MSLLSVMFPWQPLFDRHVFGKRKIGEFFSFQHRYSVNCTKPGCVSKYSIVCYVFDSYCLSTFSWGGGVVHFWSFFMSMKIIHQKVEFGIINAFSCPDRHFDMCFNWFHIIPPRKVSFQAKKLNLRKSKMADPRWRTPKFGNLMNFLSVGYFLIIISLNLHLAVLIEWKNSNFPKFWHIL